MKKSEKFALDEWLSDYPLNATFDDVLYLLVDNPDESVTPWEVVQYHTRHSIAEFISNTQSHFAAVTDEK